MTPLENIALLLWTRAQDASDIRPSMAMPAISDWRDYLPRAEAVVQDLRLVERGDGDEVAQERRFELAELKLLEWDEGPESGPGFWLSEKGRAALSEES